MKTLYMVFFSLIIAATILMTTAVSSHDIMERYVDEDYKYSIMLPGTWKKHVYDSWQCA